MMVITHAQRQAAMAHLEHVLGILGFDEAAAAVLQEQIISDVTNVLNTGGSPMVVSPMLRELSLLSLMYNKFKPSEGG